MDLEHLLRIAEAHGLADEVVEQLREALASADVSSGRETVSLDGRDTTRPQSQSESGTLFVSPVAAVGTRAASEENAVSSSALIEGSDAASASQIAEAEHAVAVQVMAPKVPLGSGNPELVSPLSGQRSNAAPTEEFELRANRFEDLGPIGVGSMGEVRRVRDPALNRVMAMKTIRPELMKRPRTLARFVEEAQATAQLDHPGILPVFELGRTNDGRLYFTMQEVRGKTFSQVMAEVHAVSYPGRWRESQSGWTFSRLMSAFQRACEAVAYAHSRGVVHRDLKPDNIMVGEHGEVLVLDWGLAKVLSNGHSEESEPVDIPGRRSGRSTTFGTVAGTPLYMPPEQARGDIDQIGPRSDVYALGAMLYEIVTGYPPYRGTTANEVLDQVVAGPPEPLPTHPSDADVALGRGSGSQEFGSKGPIPPEIAVACNRAMAREPKDRFANASELSHEVSAWLDGARKRDRALEIVSAAKDKGPLAKQLREQASALRASAERTLMHLPTWAGESRKKDAWERLERAEELEHRAGLEEVAAELLLHGALTHAPGLKEAHLELANRYRTEHIAAEDARNAAAAARAEHRLRVHAAALREDAPERRALDAYLAGTGALTLLTDPPAEVRLYEYRQVNRRLAPHFVKSLGMTPLRSISLPMGSYLLELNAVGSATVRFPVSIRREVHAHGIPPRRARSHTLVLPRIGSLGPDDVFVAGGWFTAGGDADAPNALERQRVWVDAFVMRRFVVSNREFLAFLNALFADGKEAEALRYAPRERAAGGEDHGALIYGRDPDGRFCLQPDGDGDEWHLEWPVMMIDQVAASAYAAWYAEQTGQPWRLPHELEWEKAARGTDGRFHPWGDQVDPSWCHMRSSHRESPMITVTDTYPVDESPYGVRGMGGNVSEWCANVYTDQGPRLHGQTLDPFAEVPDDGAFRVDKGGGWYDTEEYVRCAVRRGLTVTTRRSDVGFRIVRSFGTPA